MPDGFVVAHLFTAGGLYVDGVHLPVVLPLPAVIVRDGRTFRDKDPKNAGSLHYYEVS
jgi:hypothetical protein